MQVHILPMIVDLNFNEFMLSTLHVISLNNIEVASHWPAPPLSLSLVSLSPSPPPVSTDRLVRQFQILVLEDSAKRFNNITVYIVQFLKFNFKMFQFYQRVLKGYLFANLKKLLSSNKIFSQICILSECFIKFIPTTFSKP